MSLPSTFRGWGFASFGGAHQAQATIPIVILKARDGEISHFGSIGLDYAHGELTLG